MPNGCWFDSQTGQVGEATDDVSLSNELKKEHKWVQDAIAWKPQVINFPSKKEKLTNVYISTGFQGRRTREAETGS